MFGTLFQQLYNAVDVVVVGQFVGADAIASVGGSSGMVINLVVVLLRFSVSAWPVWQSQPLRHRP